MYIVDGFLFEDEATAELAKKEEEGIRFIKERTALDNPEVVLRLYKKLLDQGLFVTPVGIRFMTELQNVLLSSPYITKEDIPPIRVSQQVVVSTEGEVTPQESVKGTPEAVKRSGKEDKYKKPFQITLFFAIIFAISIMGMFLITEISGNNVNIINYRNEILNEYSSWEVELQEKEEELKAWEAELESRSQN